MTDSEIEATQTELIAVLRETASYLEDVNLANTVRLAADRLQQSVPKAVADALADEAAAFRNASEEYREYERMQEALDAYEATTKAVP